MAKPFMYNSLGQFIAEGGAISSGILTARGSTMDAIRAFIQRRVSGMSEPDFQDFYRKLIMGRDAANVMRQLDDDQTIDPSLVPMMPELFGMSPMARRLILAIDAQTDEMPRPWEVRVEQEDFWTREKLEQVIQDILIRWQAQSPDAFTRKKKAVLRQNAITELWTARRY